jgi:iron complex outermembrane receptor protein
MMASSFRAGTSIAALIGALLLPAIASAQTADAPQSPQQTDAQAATGDEIVVTAQRRTEASRDVPITVTTLGADQLAVANVNQLSDTVKLTPGLRFDNQGASSQPTIRGVGTAITTSGGGPNVGIYVDGFFQSNSYVNDFQLMKVQNIQVLKGPQGTLFGRNTTGGAILVTTADPSTDTAAEAKVSYGRFNSVTAQGYATFGLTDKVALDVEGLYRRGDGFQTNVLDGNDHIGRYENWSFRTGLKAELSDAVSVLLRYTHSETDDPTPQLVNAYVDKSGQAGFFSKVSPAGQAIYGTSSSKGLPLIYRFAPAGTFATKPNEVAMTDTVGFKTNSDVIQARVNADLGGFDLTSYTQYRHDLTPNKGDLDATALGLFYIYIGPEDKTFSQEFVLNSHAGSRLQWTAGLNYFQVRDTWDVDASFSSSPFLDFGGSSTFTKSVAAFADATYELNDKLFLTVGGRFSHDIVTDAYFKTNFTTTQYEGPTGAPISTAGLLPETKIFVKTLKNDSFTPRAVLRYKPSDQSSVYASFTRGYKAGILNVGGLSAVPVKPEKINAYEVGYKYGDRALSVDLAGYYYDYKNLQVSSYQNGAAQIRNAASSEIYGLEAQARYKLSQAFTLTGGVAWTHARYKSFKNAPYYSYCDPTAPVTSAMACGAIGPGSLTQTTTDASGLHMQRAPDFTANAGASYGLDLGGGRLTLSGNLYYSSSFYFDPSEQFKQKPYEVLALRAQWVDPSERYTVAVFGDNVTGKRYRSQVLFNTLGIGSVWAQPTTYGVSLGAKF